MIQAFASREFVLFVLCGGSAALVNFGSRLLYSRWFDFSSAVVLAYLTGMCTAYALNRLFVFTRSTRPLHQSAALFVLVNGAAVAQTWAVSMGLAYVVLPWLGVHEHVPEIAHAVGVLVPVFTSYLGHKRWTFR